MQKMVIFIARDVMVIELEIWNIVLIAESVCRIWIIIVGFLVNVLVDGKNLCFMRFWCVCSGDF